jgi:hypothetical protein
MNEFERAFARGLLFGFLVTWAALFLALVL